MLLNAAGYGATPPAPNPEIGLSPLLGRVPRIWCVCWKNPDSLTAFGLFDRDSQQTIMEEGNEGIYIVNLRVMLSNEHVASVRFPPAARSAVCTAPARESKVK